MASLYIKDPATNDRVTRMAKARGTTKTALIGQALDALDQKASIRNADGPSSGIDSDTPPTGFVEWMRWHRARNPLPPPTGRTSDKAFFDRLWGEHD